MIRHILAALLVVAPHGAPLASHAAPPPHVRLGEALEDYFLSVVGTECLDLTAARPYRLTLLAAEAEWAGHGRLRNRLEAVAAAAVDHAGAPLQLNLYAANAALAPLPTTDGTALREALSRQLASPFLLIASAPQEDGVTLTLLARNVDGQYLCNRRITLDLAGEAPGAAGEPPAAPPVNVVGNGNCGNVVVGAASDTSINLSVGCDND